MFSPLVVELPRTNYRMAKKCQENLTLMSSTMRESSLEFKTWDFYTAETLVGKSTDTSAIEASGSATSFFCASAIDSPA